VERAAALAAEVRVGAVRAVGLLAAAREAEVKVEEGQQAGDVAVDSEAGLAAVALQVAAGTAGAMRRCTSRHPHWRRS